MDWVKRINSVLEYIESNLDNEIDDNEIASLFASPQGIFQRVFANITSITLSEYIRKRRLTLAALDIKNTDEKIIDVAIKYGYNSAVAFNSAFKNFHGITPSKVRKSDIQPKTFQRFSFTLILSEKGVNSMQYFNFENAEYMMQQLVNKEHVAKYFRNISEHNGVKCACDGFRAMVILPKGKDEWDLSDAYFDVNDTNNSKFELNKIINNSSEKNLKINLSKEQATVLLASFDGAKIDHKRKLASLSTTENNIKSQEVIVCVDLKAMAIITEATAIELKGQSYDPIMSFNVRFIEEAIKFVLCSEDENVEIYYRGNLSVLIIKSGRFYALVLPIRLRDEAV